MSLQKLRTRVPRRTQQAIYSARLGRLKADCLRVYRIILLADVYHLLELATEGLRIAVGCEAHELRGVVHFEAKITADHLPREADRVRKLECFDRMDLPADGLRQRRAGRLADAVDGEDRRAIEARREICRGGMCEMVGHEMKSLP